MPKKSNRDPNQPKKPKTGYFIFCDEHREAVKEELGGKKPASEVSKVLGQRWNALTKEQKQTYLDRTKDDMQKYKKDMEVYKQNKSESEGEEEDDNKKKRKRKTTKKKKTDPDAPKRPLTSYMLFSQEQRKKIVQETPEIKVTEVAKKVGALWKQLSAEQKQPYIDKAEELKKQYKVLKEEYDKNKKEESEEEEDKKKKKKKDESEDDQEESDEESEDEESD
ncbi:hypothetical protein ABK040_009869 [Willaertia magna]